MKRFLWLLGLWGASCGQVCWAQTDPRGSNANPYRVFMSVEEADALLHVSKTGFAQPYAEYIIPKGELKGATTISGQVVGETKDGPEPVFEATVVGIHFITGRQAETLTDKDGHFTLNFVSPSRSALDGSRSGVTGGAEEGRTGRSRASFVSPKSYPLKPGASVSKKLALINELLAAPSISLPDNPGLPVSIDEELTRRFLWDCVMHFAFDPRDKVNKPLLSPSHQPNLHMRVAGIDRLITCEEFAKSSILALEELTGELSKAIEQVLSLQFLIETLLVIKVDGAVREQASKAWSDKVMVDDQIVKKLDAVKQLEWKLGCPIPNNQRKYMWKWIKWTNELDKHKKELRFALGLNAFLEEVNNYLPGYLGFLHFTADFRDSYRELVQKSMDDSRDFVSSWDFDPQRQKLAEKYRLHFQAEMLAWKTDMLVRLREWTTELASQIDTRASDTAALAQVVAAATLNPTATAWAKVASTISTVAKGVKLALQAVKIPHMWSFYEQAKHTYGNGIACILRTPDQLPTPVPTPGSPPTRSPGSSSFSKSLIPRRSEGDHLLALLDQLAAAVAAREEAAAELIGQMLAEMEQARGADQMAYQQATVLLAMGTAQITNEDLFPSIYRLLDSWSAVGAEAWTFASLTEGFILSPDTVREDYLAQITAFRQAQAQWQSDRDAFYALLDSEPNVTLPPLVAIQSVQYTDFPLAGTVFPVEVKVVNGGGGPAQNVSLELGTSENVMVQSIPKVTWDVLSAGEVQTVTFQVAAPAQIPSSTVYLGLDLGSENAGSDAHHWQMDVQVSQPPTISQLEPPDGSTTATSRPTVSARLEHFASGTFALILNGLQVQPSLSEDDVISYSPVGQRLENGTHAVLLRWVDGPQSTATVWSFQVDSGLTEEAPQIGELSPAQGATVVTNTPQIRCVLSNLQEGAQGAMFLDGAERPSIFDPATGLLSYTPDGSASAPALTEGYHTATVQVTSGGEKVVANWVFEVQVSGSE